MMASSTFITLGLRIIVVLLPSGGPVDAPRRSPDGCNADLEAPYGAAGMAGLIYTYGGHPRWPPTGRWMSRRVGHSPWIRIDRTLAAVAWNRCQRSRTPAWPKRRVRWS